MFRFRTISALATALPLALTLPASAAERFVIPAAAHAPGAFDSTWVTDLSLHNAGMVAVPLTIRFVPDGGGAPASTTLTLAGRATRRQADVLSSLFGLASGSGALVVEVDTASAGKLAVGSRTYNVTASGTFGQDVPATAGDATLGTGDRAILFTPSDRATMRQNAGVFAFEAASVTWRLLSDAGAVLAERANVAVAADSSVRYNAAVRTLFGADAGDGAAVEVEVHSGRLLAWSSRVDNRTNDGDFSVARRVRGNELPRLVGLDTGADGSADVFDEDGDLEIDERVQLSTSALAPYEMRLVVEDPEGHPLTWSAVELPASASLDPATGILRVWASASLGAGSRIRVRVSDGTDSVVITVPVGAY